LGLPAAERWPWLMPCLALGFAVGRRACRLASAIMRPAVPR